MVCVHVQPRIPEEPGITDSPMHFVFQPIFTMSAQQSQLKVMDQQRFNKFLKDFSRDTVSKCIAEISVETFCGGEFASCRAVVSCSTSACSSGRVLGDVARSWPPGTVSI